MTAVEHFHAAEVLLRTCDYHVDHDTEGTYTGIKAQIAMAHLKAAEMLIDHPNLVGVGED